MVSEYYACHVAAAIGLGWAIATVIREERSVVELMNFRPAGVE
jgi:hypothetical protein